MTAYAAEGLLEAFPDDVQYELDDAESWSLADCVRVVKAIVACRKGLATIYDTVDALGVEAAGGSREVLVPGVGPVKVRTKGAWTGWRHDDLIPVVVARLIDQPGVIWDADGERLPVHESAMQLARGLRECVSFGSGKLTGLRKYGIQPDEFATYRPDRKTLWLPS